MAPRPPRRACRTAIPGRPDGAQLATSSPKAAAVQVGIGMPAWQMSSHSRQSAPIWRRGSSPPRQVRAGAAGEQSGKPSPSIWSRSAPSDSVGRTAARPCALGAILHLRRTMGAISRCSARTQLVRRTAVCMRDVPGGKCLRVTPGGNAQTAQDARPADAAQGPHRVGTPREGRGTCRRGLPSDRIAESMALRSSVAPSPATRTAWPTDCTWPFRQMGVAHAPLG
jgi:hypothetical protein